LLDFEGSACITPDGKKHHLTPKEINVLARLLPDEFQTSRDLANQLTLQMSCEQPEGGVKRERYISENNIRATICIISNKIGREYIESRPVYGYRIATPNP